MTKEEFINHPYPGVTTILDDVFGHDEFKGIPDTVMKAAAERGTAVHEWIEHFSKTKEELPIEIAYQVYIDYFKEWYNIYKPEFIESEMMLFNEKDKYKGIIDTVFIYHDIDTDKDIMCMCDWKTSSNLNRFKTMCQLNLYKRMYDMQADYKITELRTLSLTKTGWRFSKFQISNKLCEEILHLRKLKKEYNV